MSKAPLFLFGVSTLSPLVGSLGEEGKETAKQEGRKRKGEEPAVLREKEPSKTELQL